MASFFKLLTAVVLLKSFLTIDLDIILPPGTPYDALLYSPDAIKYNNRHIPTGGIGDNNQNGSRTNGHTGTRKLNRPIAPPMAPPPISFGIQSNIPVPVKDFEMEVDVWLNQITFGTDPVADPLKYETRLAKKSRLEMYARVFTHIFIKYFHQNKTLDYHDTLAMTLIGAPAGSYSATINQVSDKLIPFSERTLKYIDPETDVPSFSVLDGEYETMLNKLIILELVSFHPFSPSPYAPGLSNFPQDEIYPYLKKLLTHPNKRVSRNALYYIGTMGKIDYLGSLFEILKTTDDNVKKVRSLYFLTMAKYPGLEEYLIKRVQEEKDKIFRVMIIDSLGKLGSKPAFPVLLAMMKQIREGDFNESYSLAKAIIRCVDYEDKDSMEELHEMYWKLHKMADDPKNFPDPVNKTSPIISYAPLSRSKIIKELAEISLSVLGNNKMVSKIEDYSKSVANNIKGVILSSPPPEGGALKNMQPSASSFIVEMSPFINKGKSIAGKWLTAQLIMTGNAHESNVFIAIDTVAKNYPDDFEEIVIKMIKNNVYPTAIDRALKYMYTMGLYGRRTETILKAIIKRFDDNSNDSHRHLATLATYYLGINGKIKETDLMRMVNYGLSRLSQEDGWKHEINQTMAWGSTFKTKSYLHLVAIEMLGKTKSKKAGKLLLNISSINDPDTKRLIAKTLGNFNGESVKKRLVEMLLDNDQWVRLNAYLSLKRITGINQDVDWFFSEPSELTPYIQKYKNQPLN